ncbi:MULTISPECIES: hypothetical protein [unclassified Pseudomonas]|uniref:hypothetical protein n=1 Tax=unclassified Pseudomonas TaxID=196821 RepID=UPI0014648BB5|nr:MULTISPECIES: hypothetical protein [unclassified Pseudomonas]QJI21402.1 hypothetical protein HKK57_25090 [Pseudomonas sp. ADAK21]QJI23445.1 hypothetical protein HKK56_08000 [Pseudomonas sp. ADAK20]
MSSIPAGFDRQDAMLQGMLKAIQALTAVIYSTSPKREGLEQQLRIFLNDKDTGLPENLLGTYKLPLEAALVIIEQIKESQAKQ